MSAPSSPPAPSRPAYWRRTTRPGPARTAGRPAERASAAAPPYGRGRSEGSWSGGDCRCGRDRAQHLGPALSGDLRTAVLDDVRLGGRTHALAQVTVVDERQELLADLGGRGRVEAGDAGLDVRVHDRVGDQRDAQGTGLEPAQVALAAVEVVLPGRRERDVHQRHS